MKQYITRSVEPIIRKIAKQFFVVAVTDQSQSGKSIMLKQLFANYEFITLLLIILNWWEYIGR